MFQKSLSKGSAGQQIALGAQDPAEVALISSNSMYHFPPPLLPSNHGYFWTRVKVWHIAGLLMECRCSLPSFFHSSGARFWVPEDCGRHSLQFANRVGWKQPIAGRIFLDMLLCPVICGPESPLETNPRLKCCKANWACKPQTAFPPRGQLLTSTTALQKHQFLYHPLFPEFLCFVFLRGSLWNTSSQTEVLIQTHGLSLPRPVFSRSKDISIFFHKQRGTLL